MSRKRLSALCLCVLAGPLAAEPTYWRVTGVASNDTLNVRAAPSADAEDIGDLAHDATGVEIGGTDASGAWGWIVWTEGNGWVSMRFLAPDPRPTLPGTGVPAGLTCAGTEPFWSLNLSQGGAVFSDMSGSVHSMGLSGTRVAEGRAGFPVQISHSGTDAASLAILAPQACSDGMSDATYPWTLSYMLNTALAQRFLTGCCFLPLEGGSH